MSPVSRASADAWRKSGDHRQVMTMDCLRIDFDSDCARTRTGHIPGQFAATDWTKTYLQPGRGRDCEWTRTNCGLAAVTVADWSWTGRGCGPRAGHSPESVRTLPSVARTLAGYSPADARISCRKLRGRFSGHYAGHPAGCGADIARRVALPSSKGMVSNQNDRLSHFRKPPKIPLN